MKKRRGAETKRSRGAKSASVCRSSPLDPLLCSCRLIGCSPSPLRAINQPLSAGASGGMQLPAVPPRSLLRKQPTKQSFSHGYCRALAAVFIDVRLCICALTSSCVLCHCNSPTLQPLPPEPCPSSTPSPNCRDLIHLTNSHHSPDFWFSLRSM